MNILRSSILSGIAIALAGWGYYYLAVPWEFTSVHLPDILILYPCLVLGNFIGCNLYRFIAPKE